MMKKYRFISFIIAAFLLILMAETVCFAQGSGGGRLYVICYHSFLGKSKIPTDVSVEELKKQMEFLKQKGFSFVSYSDISNGKVTGNKNILITIDDGNRSVIAANEKVFRPMAIRPLLGIYPNLIGKKNYALNWDELKNLSNDGFDVASHGYYHLLLNDKLYKADKKAFQNEIFKSKDVLEEKLGRKIEVFIYPNGVRSDIAKQMLKEHGYKYAFAITWGEVILPLGSNPDPMDLHRYMISGNFKQVSSIILNSGK